MTDRETDNQTDRQTDRLTDRDRDRDRDRETERETGGQTDGAETEVKDRKTMLPRAMPLCGTLFDAALCCRFVGRF